MDRAVQRQPVDHGHVGLVPGQVQLPVEGHSVQPAARAAIVAAIEPRTIGGGNCAAPQCAAGEKHVCGGLNCVRNHQQPAGKNQRFPGLDTPDAVCAAGVRHRDFARRINHDVVLGAGQVGRAAPVAGGVPVTAAAAPGNCRSASRER